MKGRSLLALSVLSLALACEGNQQPMGLKVPNDLPKIISDGAHGGNPDFFFLPPMVPLPLNNPNWELGKFNKTLKPGLRIEICELNSDFPNAYGRPSGLTTCGASVKTFPRGTVQLVNLPLVQNGWWTLFHLPADGFYYVLWDTRQSNLDVSKYYRIKVFLDGSDVPRGIADVDPMASLFQWKYSLTGEVIQLVDDVMLPIPFRIENQGGLCFGATLCTQVVVTNHTPDGSAQIVKVEGGAGALAGASFPDGWLPAGGPQSVIVTISSVNSAENADGSRTRVIPCHAGLAFQQFNGCFTFTTTPALAQVSGHQFAKAVTVAVCYALEGTGDPREKFAQLYSSGPNEVTHALVDVSDAGILGPAARSCGTTPPPVIGLGRSNPLTQLASTGWRNLKAGLGVVFGVKTAYAIDLGLGGLTFDFSNVGPALPVQIQSYSSTGVTLGPGVTTTTARAQIVGFDHHNVESAPSGVNRVPVTFTVAAGNGTLRAVGSEAAPAAQVTVNTSTMTVFDGEISTLVPGIASVVWTPPTAPNTYTMTASGPGTGAVIYTATVSAALPNPVLAFTGSSFQSGFVQYDLAVTNYQSYPAEMFVPRSDLPPCGLNTSASRTWVDIFDASNGAYIYGFCALGSPSGLQTIWFGIPTNGVAPQQVYITLTDRAANVVYTSNTVSVAPPP